MALAGLLQQWLPTVFNGLEPTYSPDIPKGERCYEAISRELSQLAKKIETYLPEKPSRDGSRHIKENLKDFRTAIESLVSRSTDTSLM